MYLSATAHLILSFYSDFVSVFNQDGVVEGPGLDTGPNGFQNPKSYIQVALEMVNYIIGDSVVVWRTWVIGGKNLYIVIFPAVCTLGGLISGIGLAYSHANALREETITYNTDIYKTDMVNWFESFGTFTCAINIYAVAIISYKTWQNVRSHRALGIRMTIGGGGCYSVLLILIESGIVYCFLLVMAVVFFSIQSPGVYIVKDVLSQMTGIYPTVIVVLVRLKLSWENTVVDTSLLTSVVQFAQPPISSVGTNTNITSRGLHGMMFGDGGGVDGLESSSTNRNKTQDGAVQKVRHGHVGEDKVDTSDNRDDLTKTQSI
ncbi:hypothetical protein QCA50_008353 [Cerrena zonata]|uniref:Uncharacterized protein n=1 Tax=Cerrena zonata TaxID=2478898 RepID=A0AAW0G2P3_9APHY